MITQPPLFRGVHSPGFSDELCETSANAAALSAVRAWTVTPSGAAVIAGEAGCGKSVLLREAARLWPGAVTADPAEPDAVFDGRVFGDVRGGLPPLVLLEASAEGIPEEARWLHAMNLATETGVPLLIAVRAEVAAAAILPDLASRLRRCIIAAFPPPDDEMMRLLTAKAFMKRQLIVSDSAAAFLAPRLQRTYRAAEEAADLLDALALERQSPVTVRLIKELFP